MTRIIPAARALTARFAETVHVAATRLQPLGHGDQAGPPADQSTLSAIRDAADAMLRHHVMPFWALHSWDEPYGGFLLELGLGGTRLGPTTRSLVPQARLVWSLAAAHRYGLREHDYLDLARRGAHFLMDRLWDPQHGGFFDAVDRDGAPIRPAKHTYGQGFAIYALAEYALASGEAWASAAAVQAFDALVARADDGRWGYREHFDRAWNPAATPAGAGKTVNVHLHMVEALTPLYTLTRDVRHAERLRAVLRLVLERGVDRRDGFSINDRVTRDWQWRSSWRHPIGVSYGHGVELAWLTRLALDALGDDDGDAARTARRLVDHALQYGFDPAAGGIATFGPPIGAARRAWYLPREWRATRWWEQCEMLAGLIVAYDWFRAPAYLAAFVKQFEHVRIPTAARGPGAFDPAVWGSHDWKDPYHGVRALIQVATRLSPTMLSR